MNTLRRLGRSVLLFAVVLTSNVATGRSGDEGTAKGPPPSYQTPPVLQTPPATPPVYQTPPAYQPPSVSGPYAIPGAPTTPIAPSWSAPWVTIAGSFDQTRSGAYQDAQERALELQRAGFPAARVYDGRYFPNFRCCYWSVIVGTYSTSAEARGLAAIVEAYGFESYSKHAFEDRRR